MFKILHLFVLLHLPSLLLSLNLETHTCSNAQDRDSLALQLASTLVGLDSKITIVSAEIAGDCEQFGIFSNGTSVTKEVIESGGTKIPFVDSGVTISTGYARYATRSSNTDPGNTAASVPDSYVTPNCSSIHNTNENTPLLNSQYCQSGVIECEHLCDSARLSFNFTLNETSDLSVSYVFASEEYNSYVGYHRRDLQIGPTLITRYDVFSDIFAFFLDGENLATAADGSYVGVQTVNRGNPCMFFFFLSLCRIITSSRFQTQVRSPE